MHIRAYKHGILSSDILVQQRIYKMIGFLLIQIQMVHTILFATYFRVIVSERQ